MKLSVALAAVATLLAIAAPAVAQDNPKIPPGSDPGAVPVALVGLGIDYTDPALSSRLARDGEGNIVGWDFVDKDIFPFSKDAASNAQAKLLLANPGVELVPVRVDAADYKGVGGAASFLSHTPVRIVVVTLTSAKKEDWAIFTKAAQVFPKLLFVVPADDEAAPVYPAALNLANVLSVAPPLAKDQTANVAAAAPANAADSPATAIDSAIVVAAAFATCHAPIVGDGDGKSRKAAILSKLAKPRSVSRVPAIERCP